MHWFEDNDLEGLYQLRGVHAQHHAIVRSICAGEGSRAEVAMRGHIEFAANHIRAKYSLAKEGEIAAATEAPDDLPEQAVIRQKTERRRTVRQEEKSLSRRPGRSRKVLA
ncbi:MAG: hypothetical protein AB7L36_12330 [Sphingomonadaceae bacterium]